MSGEAIAGVHTNNRYFRYRAVLETTNSNLTPVLDAVSFDFKGVCVPAGHVLFQNLTDGTYILNVSAPGFANASTSVAVAGAWQQVIVELQPN